ncbi:MAG TPA: orotate phosphoribosyltransferase, partial [Clostridia bacterium]|nr:orotate phosphoribosyltransferase [Clostridia bacterium]
ENDDIYQGLIDMMVSFIKETMDINDINFISGGERRDWFFSLIIADKLKKPHITLFKDHSATLFENGKSIILKDIRTLKLGQNILHVADIITIASSYKNVWIPAINKLGGMIVKSLVVVDRMQGGKDYLATEGIESYALINMDISVFEKARDMGLLSNEQLSMIVEYYQSPTDSMKKFLIEHPEFLEQSLKCDGRDAERARNCIDRDIYGIYS